MTILELGARRVPQVLVNGRLSDRSFKSWKKRAYIAEALFENLAHVVAQSEVDGERFLALGARPVTVSGNLKVDTNPPPVDERALTRSRGRSGRARPGRRSRPMTARRRWRRRSTRCCARAIRACSPSSCRAIPTAALALAVEFAAMGLKVVQAQPRRAHPLRHRHPARRHDRRDGALPQADRDRLRRPLADLRGRPEPARAGDARHRRACRPQRAEFPRGLSAADRQRRRQARARPRHAGRRGQFPAASTTARATT